MRWNRTKMSTAQTGGTPITLDHWSGKAPSPPVEGDERPISTPVHGAPGQFVFRMADGTDLDLREITAILEAHNGKLEKEPIAPTFWESVPVGALGHLTYGMRQVNEDAPGSFGGEFVRFHMRGSRHDLNEAVAAYRLEVVAA